MTWKVKTEYPLAFDSPDHLYPYGTKGPGNSSPEFVDFVNADVGLGARVLCLGCSGGKLVHDLISTDHKAVGLEGSDYHVKNRSAYWPEHHNKELFTCDISRPFEVFEDGQPAKFDLITMWDVLEHISEDRLETLFSNIHRHLDAGGVFIGTVCTRPSPHPQHEGVDLHQTIQPEKWWKEKLSKWFVDTGTQAMPNKVWWSMICWHGKDRKNKVPSKTCYDWSMWIYMRKRLDIG